MQKLKLTPKQKEKLSEALRNTNQAREIAQQASQQFGQCEAHAKSLLELIYESNGITPPKEGQFKIEGDYLIIPELKGGLKERVLKVAKPKTNGTKSKVSSKK